MERNELVEGIERLHEELGDRLTEEASEFLSNRGDIDSLEGIYRRLGIQRQLRDLPSKKLERKYKWELRKAIWKLRLLNLFVGDETLMNVADRIEDRMYAFREEDSYRYIEEGYKTSEKLLDLEIEYLKAHDQRLAIRFMM